MSFIDRFRNIVKGKKRLTPSLKQTAPARVDNSLAILKSAEQMARNPENPNRVQLYSIYEQIVKDSHLSANVRTAKIAVQKSDFQIMRNGKADDKATLLLNTPWFDAFISHALDAEFWGHSLIEFHYDIETKAVGKIILIPRKHVKPESGIVVAEIADDSGWEYRDNKETWGLVEIGRPNDLGLYLIAATEVLIKNYARSDWSQASEKYGMPLLKIKTNTEDSKELDRLEDMAQNFAANGYVIINNEDDAEIIQPPGRNFFSIYEKSIKMCDEQISKIINGQTGSSDQKSYAGAAEVHERILNDYTFSRMRRMQHIINRELLPFLTNVFGYPFAGCEFRYTDLEKKDIKPKPETPKVNANGLDFFD